MTREELLTAANAEANDVTSWAIISEDDHGAVFIEGDHTEESARKTLRHHYQDEPSAFVARRVVTFEAVS